MKRTRTSAIAALAHNLGLDIQGTIIELSNIADAHIWISQSMREARIMLKLYDQDELFSIRLVDGQPRQLTVIPNRATEARRLSCLIHPDATSMFDHLVDELDDMVQNASDDGGEQKERCRVCGTVVGASEHTKEPF